MRYNIFLIKVSILFLVFIFTTGAAAIGGTDKSFEEIVSGVDAKFDAIETITANIVRTSQKGKETVEERWNYYYKNPDKIKVEYLKPQKRFLILNGNKYIEYIPEAKKALVVDLSTYKADDKTAFCNNAFARVSIVGVRLGGIKKDSIIKINQTKLNDFDADFVESRTPNVKFPSYQLWVDVVSNALLKHIIYDEKGAVVYSTEGTDFKKFKNNFMLPQKIKLILPSEEIAEKTESSVKVIKSEMLLNNLKVNDGVSDDFFNFKIPDDVKIINK